MAIPVVLRETDFTGYDLTYSNHGEGMLKLLKDVLVNQLGWSLIHEDGSNNNFVIADVDNTAMIRFYTESGDGTYYFRYEVAHSYSDVNTAVNPYRSGIIQVEYIALNGYIIGTNKAFYIGGCSNVSQTTSKASQLLFFGMLNTYVANDPNGFIVSPNYPTASQFDNSTPNSGFVGTLLDDSINNALYYSNNPSWLWSFNSEPLSEIFPGLRRPKTYSPSSWDYSKDSDANPGIFNKVLVVKKQVDSVTKGMTMIGEYPGLYCAVTTPKVMSSVDALSTIDLNGTDYIIIPSQGYISDLIISLGDWG